MTMADCLNFLGRILRVGYSAMIRERDVVIKYRWKDI